LDYLDEIRDEASRRMAGFQ